MHSQPGLSWGYDAPINLIRSSKGFVAFYCFPEGSREIVKIFKLKTTVEWYRMMDRLREWNYGTLELCSIVKLEMDSQS